MAIIIVVLLLVLIYWIYMNYRGKNETEQFTVIRSDPQNARLELENYFEEEAEDDLDINSRIAKKNIETGKHAADANRGAQKSRVEYLRPMFEEDFERNEELNWWESPLSKKEKDEF